MSGSMGWFLLMPLFDLCLCPLCRGSVHVVCGYDTHHIGWESALMTLFYIKDPISEYSCIVGNQRAKLQHIHFWRAQFSLQQMEKASDGDDNLVSKKCRPLDSGVC